MVADEPRIESQAIKPVPVFQLVAGGDPTDRHDVHPVSTFIAAAMRDLGNEDRREVGRWLNNRRGNSHLPFRRRKRAMLGFRRMKSLQKFASIHASPNDHFNHERHLVDRQTFKHRRSAALAEWREIAG
jgi:hypothetical protein